MKSGTERPTATEDGALPRLLGRAGFRVIDLSMVLKDDPSPFLKVKVTNLGHDIGAQDHQKYLGVDPQDWPNPGNSCGDDFLETTTHAGTHMDAPIHFGPWTIPDHKEPRRIDAWPLEWCMGDGVVLDIRDIPQAHEVSAAEVQQRLDRIGYQLKPFDIVLVMTGNDKVWGTPEYLDRGGHLGREALKFILDQGVKVVGTDSWSFDRPGKQWAADYLAHGRDPKYLWPCHVLGLEMEYAHMEKMTNLDLLPAHGFTVIALPIKVHRGSAGFIRAVALVPE
jgi:kynurenine formamidase